MGKKGRLGGVEVQNIRKEEEMRRRKEASESEWGRNKEEVGEVNEEVKRKGRVERMQDEVKMIESEGRKENGSGK